MPSREMRRANDKDKKTSVEVNKEKHPIFYVISILVLIIVVIAFIFAGSESGGSPNRRVFGDYKGQSIEWLDNNYFG